MIEEFGHVLIVVSAMVLAVGGIGLVFIGLIRLAQQVL